MGASQIRSNALEDFHRPIGVLVLYHDWCVLVNNWDTSKYVPFYGKGVKKIWQQVFLPCYNCSCYISCWSQLSLSQDKNNSRKLFGFLFCIYILIVIHCSSLSNYFENYTAYCSEKFSIK